MKGSFFDKVDFIMDLVVFMERKSELLVECDCVMRREGKSQVRPQKPI